MRGIKSRRMVGRYNQYRLEACTNTMNPNNKCTEQLINIKISLISIKNETYMIEKEKSKYDKGKPRRSKGDGKKTEVPENLLEIELKHF